MQRKFGAEKESKVIVEQGGKVIKGWETIGTKNNYYDIDIDHNDGNSILEFVTPAFDEHLGALAAAQAIWTNQLNEIWDIITAAKDAKDNTDLKTVTDAKGAVLGGKYQDIKVRASKTPYDGPVHFTIGFALETIPSLLRETLSNEDRVYQTEKDSSLVHAANTGRLRKRLRPLLAGAGAAPAALPAVSVERLKGYLSLLYLHVAAQLDGVKMKDPAMRKNLTQALSRVSMSKLRTKMNAAETAWLDANKDQILAKMQSLYSGKKGKWGDHKKDTALIPDPARDIITGALGKHQDNPIKSWGEMNVFQDTEDVGPVPQPAAAGVAVGAGGAAVAAAAAPAPAPRNQGVALELRKFLVNRSDKGSIDTLGKELIAYSRLLHGTDQPAAAVAAPAPAPAPAPVAVANAAANGNGQPQVPAPAVDGAGQAQAVVANGAPQAGGAAGGAAPAAPVLPAGVVEVPAVASH